MKRALTKLVLALVALAGTGCGSAHLTAQTGDALIVPLYGTLQNSVSAESKGTSIVVNFDAASSDTYAQLELPTGMTATNLDWTGLNSASGSVSALAIALPNRTSLEVGLCRIPGAAALPISLTVNLTPNSRMTSVAPTGSENVIADLTVVDLGNGQVALGWTQINNGDLDLNGEVNTADLKPIATHFNASYDTTDPDKWLLPDFWADADGNGMINAADISVLGKHYHSAVAGYNIRKNGVLVPGTNQGEPSILPSLGQEQGPGLPKRYSVLTAGAGTDTWKVTAVDTAGAEGTDSTGLLGTTDIVANLTINGLPLLDLNGTNAGSFGGAKFSSRVIDPIENVGSIKFTPTPLAAVGSTTVFTGIPRAKTLFLNFKYLPTLNLATGQPKSPSSLRRQGSAVDESEYVNTAVPFVLPAGAGTAQVDADISLSPNPTGGYFVELVTTLTVPGQLPTTTKTRLAFASRKLNRDANNDSSFDDDPTFFDTDRDCISDSLLLSSTNDDKYTPDDRIEGKLVGVVGSVDTQHGTITLSSRTPVGGDFILPDAPLTLNYSEQSHFDAGLDPAQFNAGTELAIEYYVLHDPAGIIPDLFWIKTVAPKDEHSGAFIEASDNKKLQIEVRWTKLAGFSIYRLERLAPNPSTGHYEVDLDQDFPPGGADQYTDTAVVVGTVYQYKYYGVDGQNVVQLGLDTGVALPSDG